MKRLVAAIVLMASMQAAFGGIYDDGHVLNDRANAYTRGIEGKALPADTKDTWLFIGYVEGVTDAYNSVLCEPAEVKLDQELEIVKRYLKSHPESWHRSANIIVLTALMEAFPCPKSPGKPKPQP